MVSRRSLVKSIGKSYDLTKPQGVRGRNSDNTRLKEVLDWEPHISLEDGLQRTYAWIAGGAAEPNNGYRRKQLSTIIQRCHLKTSSGLEAIQATTVSTK